jgi:hypothetical protein
VETNTKIALIGFVGVIGAAIIAGLFGLYTKSGNSIDANGNANSTIIQGVQGNVTIGISEVKMSEMIAAIHEKDQNAVSLGTIANLRKSFDLGFILFSSDGITINYAPSGVVDWVDADWSEASLTRLDGEYWITIPPMISDTKQQKVTINTHLSFKLPPIGKASCAIALLRSGLRLWVFSLSMQDGYVAYGIGFTLNKEPSGFEIATPVIRAGRL